MKVADFGFSIDIGISIVEYYKQKNNNVFPLTWTAPEALEKDYTFKSDV